MKNLASCFFSAGALALLCLVAAAVETCAAPVIRTASGANAAAILATVDQFRTDLGGVNNGVGSSFATGRREINWDGVPDNFASPNNLPVGFFNVNSPLGVVLTPAVIADLRVSVNSGNPTNTPIRFGEIDVYFYVPGTSTPATVSGFGVFFSDVDLGSSSGIILYGQDGKPLSLALAPVANGGLSFVGISFNAGERIYHVKIASGIKSSPPQMSKA